MWSNLKSNVMYVTTMTMLLFDGMILTVRLPAASFAPTGLLGGLADVAP